MFTKIFVGYDGSDQGKDALALARLLAAPSNGAVIAVCVYPYEPTFSKAGGSDTEYHDALRREAVGILEGAEGATERRSVPGSSPSRALQELAENENADLLVVGSTHHGAVGRVLIGSVGERLLHGAHCPVGVAPKGFATAEDPSLRRVAVGFDGSPEAGRALELAARLAGEAHGTIHIYWAVEPPGATSPVFAGDYGWPSYSEKIYNAAHDQIDEAIASLPSELEPRGDVLSGKAAPTLAAEVVGEADLLVLGSRGYGSVRGVLLGRVSAELARSAPCPLLVVPRGAAVPGEPEEASLAAT